MKHALSLLAALALATPAIGQTAPGSAPSAEPPMPAQVPPTAPSSNEAAGGVKALRASCRDEAGSKGLTGSAKREAVSACVVRQRPDLAGREQCRSAGFDKGLRKEELHAYVKDCLKTKG